MSKKSIIIFLIILISLFSGIGIIFFGLKQLRSNLIILGSIVLTVGLVGVVKLYNDY